ncbi:MAG: N-glycosylase/DNA lyase [Candidatus Nanoarchaeia archaeon]|jgi:N-glycosylase/DNA lyase
MSLLEKMQKVRVKQDGLLKQRLSEFQVLKKASSKKLFNELCFCLLTANFNAERSIRIQKLIGNGFLELSQEELSLRLKELSHRFPNKRAEFIIGARKVIEQLKERISSLNEPELREWLVKNVKGLGMKEASHFMRNIGFNNVAIIDFHILDLLEREGIIKKPKVLNKNNYLLIEEQLKLLGSNLAELDLVLWFIETGRILK